MKISPATISRYALREKIAKALAHTSRLHILDLIQHQEMSVNELADKISLDQSTVSKHLGILKNAGLIKERRMGTTHFYSVACGCLDDFFVCLEKLIEPKVNKRKVKSC